MLAALTPQASWYVARSSGFVAWALAAASVTWGLALSTRLVRRRGAPAWLLDLHRFLGTLTLVFVGLHLVGLWADSYVQLGVTDLLVPMASSWRPVAVAWGVVALWLLLAVQVTSWTMRWLPRRLWRRVHLASGPMLVLSSVHALQAGTDASNLLVQWAAVLAASLVLFLVAFRQLARSGEPARRRPAPR